MLAADSRLTIGSGTDALPLDRAQKVWILAPPNQHLGIGFYGKAQISLRNAESLIAEFGQMNRERKTVPVLARELLDHLRSRWDGFGEAVFCVAGYDATSHYGYLYQLALPDGREPKEAYGSAAVGLLFGGQKALAERLVYGYNPELLGRLTASLGLTPHQQELLGLELRKGHLNIPLHHMPTPDVVAFCASLIRATARTQRYAFGESGVGGPVRTIVLERNRAARFA